ncbi:SP_0198 family lipoprotein [Falseniella ignava]
MKIRTFTLSIASVAILSLLAACAPTAQPTSQQQSSQQQSSSSTATSASQAQTSSGQSSLPSKTENIDGTYHGQDDGVSITLIVTGTTGTWTKVKPDGEQEVKQVTFDPENQRMIIGDNVKIYAINGNQITIDDMDRDSLDRVVLSK